MRKLVIAILAVAIAGCGGGSTGTTSGPKKLYEVLTTQSDGGASIRFYEILNDPNEIRMLLSDDNLRRKVRVNDTSGSNFIILNMGEQQSGGYSITVESVVETTDKIIVTVKDIVPEPDAMTTSQMTKPYCIVKINSKKEIEIK